MHPQRFTALRRLRIVEPDTLDKAAIARIARFAPPRAKRITTMSLLQSTVSGRTLACVSPRRHAPGQKQATMTRLSRNEGNLGF